MLSLRRCVRWAGAADSEPASVPLRRLPPPVGVIVVLGNDAVADGAHALDGDFDLADEIGPLVAPGGTVARM